MPKNMNLLLTLLNHFKKHGGYWEINSSEEDNIEIRWCPMMSDSRGMHEDIFCKRVYDIKTYIQRMNDSLTESGNEYAILEIS